MVTKAPKVEHPLRHDALSCSKVISGVRAISTSMVDYFKMGLNTNLKSAVSHSPNQHIHATSTTHTTFTTRQRSSAIITHTHLAPMQTSPHTSFFTILTEFKTHSLHNPKIWFVCDKRRQRVLANQGRNTDSTDPTDSPSLHAAAPGSLRSTDRPTAFVIEVFRNYGPLLTQFCVHSYSHLFIANGGKILDSWPVTEIIPDSSHGSSNVEIVGPLGQIRATAMVICPGAWANNILPLIGIHLPLRVEKILVQYWRLVEPNVPKYVLLDHSSQENRCYGLPDVDYPGYMKVCFHGGPVVDPNQCEHGDLSKVRTNMKRYISQYFPCLDPNCAIEEPCMYTIAPDWNFVLDRHPVHQNIVFAAGFSGTGFKLAPACGEALARLICGEPLDLDFSAFGLNRFSKTSKLL
ncbi:unnamed protein product, partial [Meganyctiphanes norvegica]